MRQKTARVDWEKKFHLGMTYETEKDIPADILDEILLCSVPSCEEKKSRNLVC